MKRFVSVLVLTVCAWSGVRDGAEAGGITLTELIENVRRNEQLYENVEVLMNMSYDIGNRAPAMPTEVIRQQWRTRYISQGEWFRVERRGGSEDSTHTASNDRVRAFDGEFTRLLEQNAVGNIVPGRLEDENFIRPHEFFYRAYNLRVPLSVYLSGHEAIRAHPGGYWPDGCIIEVTYRGEDEFGGQRCHRVHLNSVCNGTPYEGEDLWLAEERNYLPVKRVAFLYRSSKDIPSGQAVADDLREIAPGVWFPFNVEVTSYDKNVIEQVQRQQLRWQKRYVVERAELDPQYDRKMFSSVDFADGVAVYEVEKGEIVKAWRQGAPEAPGGPKAWSGFLRNWLLWLNGAIFMALAIVLYIRKARASKAISTKTP